tara:strand:- start:500 stop:1123 length:624 start_codon:yes stop_codon:yes gene_type:complete
MRVIHSSVFVVLVFTCLPSMARPHLHSPDPSIEQVENPNKDIKHPLQNEDVSITPFKEPPTEVVEREFYPYRQSLTPRIGFLVDSTELRRLRYSLGVSYMFPSYDNPFIEAGVDVTSNSLGFVHVTRRHIFNQHHYFRPFYKYGIAHLVDPDKELGSFVSIENYYLRITGGIEDVLEKPKSIRLELELSLGTTNAYINLIVGWSYGF